MTGEQAGEQEAQLIDVRGGGDRLSADLLGGGAGGGQGQARGGFGRRGPGLEELRDAEVQELDLALGSHQEVRRLEIAMHDEIAMCRLDGARDLDDQADPLLDAELRAIAVEIDRDAFDVLEHEVGQATAIDSAIEQVRDVGMVEPGEDPALLFEAANGLGGARGARQHFERGALLEAAVGPGDEIDQPHAAAADRLHDRPGADRLAGGEPLVSVLGFGDLPDEGPQRRDQRRQIEAGVPEQLLDLQPQSGVAGTANGEKSRTLDRIEVERVGEYRVDFGETTRQHGPSRSVMAQGQRASYCRALDQAERPDDSKPSRKRPWL